MSQQNDNTERDDQHAERREQERLANRGTASRMADHNAVRRAGGTPRQAIRAYCAGNRWLEENARAVGNW